MIKSLGVGVVVIVSLFSSVSARWDLVGSFPGLVAAGYFFNENRGLITVDGDDGNPVTGAGRILPRIYRTYDGGKSWIPSNIPANYFGIEFTDMFMTDSLNGWVVFQTVWYRRNVWRTTDGGVNWVECPGTAEEATGVVEAGRGVFYTKRYTRRLPRGLYFSPDKGMNFMQLSGIGLNGIAFTDDLHGVASTFNGVTLVTSDGGYNWGFTSQTIEAWGVYADRGTPNFVLAGEDLNTVPTLTTPVTRSTNYGASWAFIGSIPTRNTGHIAGVGNTIYVQTQYYFNNATGLFRSTDGGYSWRGVGGPKNYRDTRFCVTGCNGAVVYAFDVSGNVYKTTDGGDGYFSPQNALTLTKQSVNLQASVCNTTRDSIPLVNTTCNSIRIDNIGFADSSDEAVQSKALRFANLPSLPLTLLTGGSTRLSVIWDPLKSSQPLPSSNVSIKISCSLFSGSYKFDTIITVTARSSGLKPAAILDSASYSLEPVDICRLRDTVLHIINPGCDTMYLTSASFDTAQSWQILDAVTDTFLRLPLRISPNEKVTIRVRFKPTHTGIDHNLLHLSFTQRGNTLDTSLTFTSLTYRLAAANMTDEIDFGAVSSCLVKDTIVTITNFSCEEMVIDSINILSGSSYSIVDNHQYPIYIQPDSSIQVRILYLPVKGRFDNAVIRCYYSLTGDTSSVTALLFGVGIHGFSQYQASTSSQHYDFEPKNVCQYGDSFSFAIQNPGCDTLTIQEVELLGDPNIYSLTISNQIPTILISPTEFLEIGISATPAFIGDHSAVLRIRYQMSDGAVYDTLYTFRFIVSRGPRLYTMYPSSIIFPTSALCVEKDTMIIITNIGCDTLRIESLDNTDPHFSMLSNRSFPIQITRGTSDTFYYRYSSRIPGAYSDQLTITTNADSLPVRMISLDASTNDKDYLQLRLDNITGPVAAGDTAKIAIIPDKTWLGKDVKNISATISYNSDLLTNTAIYDGLTVANSTIYRQVAPNRAELELKLSALGDEVPIIANQPIAVLAFLVSITDTVTTSVSIDNIHINDGDSYYRDCILDVQEDRSQYTMSLLCGERLLQNLLAKKPILSVSYPVPNPLTSESGYILQLPIEAAMSQNINIVFTDQKGNNTFTMTNLSLVKGKNDLRIDLSAVHSGLYNFQIIPQVLGMPVNGKVVILK